MDTPNFFGDKGKIEKLRSQVVAGGETRITLFRKENWWDGFMLTARGAFTQGGSGPQEGRLCNAELFKGDPRA